MLIQVVRVEGSVVQLRCMSTDGQDGSSDDEEEAGADQQEPLAQSPLGLAAVTLEVSCSADCGMELTYRPLYSPGSHELRHAHSFINCRISREHKMNMLRSSLASACCVERGGSVYNMFGLTPPLDTCRRSDAQLGGPRNTASDGLHHFAHTHEFAALLGDGTDAAARASSGTALHEPPGAAAVPCPAHGAAVLWPLRRDGCAAALAAETLQQWCERICRQPKDAASAQICIISQHCRTRCRDATGCRCG